MFMKIKKIFLGLLSSAVYTWNCCKNATMVNLV